MSITQKKKLYFCFPLTGPNNGVKIISNYIYDSFDKNNDFKLKIVDTSQASDYSNFGKFNLKKIFKTIKIFKKLFNIKRGECAYINTTPSGFAFYRDLLLIYLCWLKNANITLHIHANGLENNLSSLNLWLFKKTKIIVINKKQYSNLLPFGLNLHIINNALPDFNNAKFSFDNTNNNSCIKLAFLSNISIKKGAERLKLIVEVLKGMDLDFQLNICGGILDKKSEIIINNLTKRYNFVSFYGPVVKLKSKQKFLNDNDLLLLLSNEDYEVSPLVYIEALMAGIPILTTKQVVSSEIIKEGCAFLLNKDCSNIDEILKLWKMNPEELVTLKHKCRSLYLRNYSFDDFQLKVKSIILK